MYGIGGHNPGDPVEVAGDPRVHTRLLARRPETDDASHRAGHARILPLVHQGTTTVTLAEREITTKSDIERT